VWLAIARVGHPDSRLTAERDDGAADPVGVQVVGGTGSTTGCSWRTDVVLSLGHASVPAASDRPTFGVAAIAIAIRVDVRKARTAAALRSSLRSISRIAARYADSPGDSWPARLMVRSAPRTPH
jgi:hypothetical protein